MQIVLAGYDTPWTDGFEDKLATYKYRDDVVLLKDPEWKETVRLAAAAYAMVYPSVSDTLPLAPLLALQAGIPLVASDIPVVRALGDVAEWVDNDRLEDGFSQAMMRLYKDESHKQQLVQKAKQLAGGIGRPRMLEAVGEIIGVYPLPLK
jgi:glycosyltransferase involved in cell wall biosynthesis